MDFICVMDGGYELSVRKEGVYLYEYIFFVVVTKKIFFR